MAARPLRLPPFLSAASLLPALTKPVTRWRQDASSLTFLTAFAPLPSGGFSITFDNLNGRSYTIRRSTNLQNWQIIASNLAGTGNPITRNGNPGSCPKFFYRIEVSQGPSAKPGT